MNCYYGCSRAVRPLRQPADSEVARLLQALELVVSRVHAAAVAAHESVHHKVVVSVP